MLPRQWCISISWVVIINFVECNLQLPKPNMFNKNPPENKIGDCQVCKILVESFKHGMKLTERGKFEGGDAAWEEEKLKSYSRSEIRLVELQENLCAEVKKHKDQCYSLASDAEQNLEDWWFEEKMSEDNLYEWLCIDNLKACCPKHHYGKDCAPCHGAPDNICSGHGKCRGEGTRKGDGQCSCNKGFSGLSCKDCAKGFYLVIDEAGETACSQCHNACKETCSGEGPKGCVKCEDGWIMDSEEGCIDVNECLQDVCGNNEYCDNMAGSYTCSKCHETCDGCSGVGADNCDKCANGYLSYNGFCVTTPIEKDSKNLKIARYTSYIGLFTIVYFIMKKSKSLGALMVILILTSISVSEYVLPEKAVAQEYFWDLGNLRSLLWR